MASSCSLSPPPVSSRHCILRWRLRRQRQPCFCVQTSSVLYNTNNYNTYEPFGVNVSRCAYKRVRIKPLRKYLGSTMMESARNEMDLKNIWRCRKDKHGLGVKGPSSNDKLKERFWKESRAHINVCKEGTNCREPRRSKAIHVPLSVVKSIIPPCPQTAPVSFRSRMAPLPVTSGTRSCL